MVDDGEMISGNLVISRSKEIAVGSDGTIVFDGIYKGRHVAVKRLLRSHHDDLSVGKIGDHPNIVRRYGVEIDEDFIYVALERCIGNLYDLIYQSHPQFKYINLWKPNGCPTPQLLKLMRDMVCGIAHLRELRIIRGDLTPRNVLINKDRGELLSSKLSDMAITDKHLLGGFPVCQPDFSSQGWQPPEKLYSLDFSNEDWQAPEQLEHQLQKHQTSAVDLFSLGCLLFFCVTGGKSPFGVHSFERKVNISRGRKDLSLVANMPEAHHLLTRLLDPNPCYRPKVLYVLYHPFFWSSEMRLSFLRDVSDRVELRGVSDPFELRDDRKKALCFLKSALESTATVVLNNGKWDEKLEAILIKNFNNIGIRHYQNDSVCDLLRIIRNMLNHYRELSQETQELLGPLSEGFDTYFSSRFPRLLMEVYEVIYSFCREEEFFLKYTSSNVI